VRERAAKNIAIAVGLALLGFCGLPAACGAHDQLRKPVVGALSAIGLCQPEWRLFAPNVHKTNSYLQAEVTLADGSRRHWQSPDFGKRDVATRLMQGQLPKFYDNLRLDRHRAAWRPLAEWIAREVAPAGDARVVRLERRFWDIPAPDAAGWAQPPPPREAYRSHVFYERRLR
jgi:hypothetical protein